MCNTNKERSWLVDSIESHRLIGEPESLIKAIIQYILETIKEISR